MNEIRQYRPAFFEGFENEILPFETLEELVSIPWVEKFSMYEEFHQFSVAGPTLMAEYGGGRKWFVVGTLKEAVPELPKWGGGSVK